MWEQWSGHFNLGDPSWRFVPRLVSLCSNTELPHQDDKDYSAAICHLCLFSLRLPPFNALALFIPLHFPHITTIFITQRHSTLCECLHPRHKVINTEMPLSCSDDEQCDSNTRTHTRITYNHCVHISQSVWNNKQVEIWLWVRRTNAVLMSFWKMKSVRTMTNEVTGVQHSNKTPWAVKLCFQTTAPSKWDRWENCLWMICYNSCKTPAQICWSVHQCVEFKVC